MMRTRKPRLPHSVPSALALSIAALFATVGLAARAQQPAVTLPAEITSWMSRNQVPRWAAMIRAGETLFNEGTCYRCHGKSGTGGRSAPDLTDKVYVQGDGSLVNIGEVIMWGVRRRDLADKTRPFQMNPSGGMDLDQAKLDALTAYVWSLRHGTFLPAR